MHSMATIAILSSPKRTTSFAPGSAIRRRTISATSCSGEMMTSIGMFSRENRSR